MREFFGGAPIYQPNRAKRLTYDLCRKHAKVEFIRIVHRLRKKDEARTNGLEERAKALGFPIQRGEAVLVYIDERNHPHYVGIRRGR